MLRPGGAEAGEFFVESGVATDGVYCVNDFMALGFLDRAERIHPDLDAPDPGRLRPRDPGDLSPPGSHLRERTRHVDPAGCPAQWAANGPNSPPREWEELDGSHCVRNPTRV